MRTFPSTGPLIRGFGKRADINSACKITSACMRQARRNLKSTAAVCSCAAARFTWTHGRGIAWDCVSLIGWLPHLSVCASGCLSVSKLAVCLLACLSAGREAKAVAVASWGGEPGNPRRQRHPPLSRAWTSPHGRACHGTLMPKNFARSTAPIIRSGVTSSS